MNNTNRVLNRTGILLIGVVLTAVGGFVAGASLVADWLDAWKAWTKEFAAWSGRLIDSTPFADTGHSWILLAVVALAIIAIVLLMVAVFRQGRGRTAILVTEQNEAGGIAVDSSVAEESIREALKGHPDLVSVRVTTYRVRDASVIGISVNTRRGISPTEVRAAIDRVVDRWDAVLGRELPVVISLHGGIPSRLAKTTRLSEPMP
ncbi:MAG TPA: hypothetical protein VGC18_00590 [Lacisediminihabitans sp.]|uniref:hypothetical protein n=1 Tax=Lacisediminihabitans sp. TaxID=2787631 RepID=UPI002ED7D8CA